MLEFSGPSGIPQTEKIDIKYSVPKMKMNNQIVLSGAKMQKLTSVKAWVTRICLKVTTGTQSQGIFSWEVHGYFSKTVLDLVVHMLCSFVDTESVCLTDLTAVQICTPLTNYDDEENQIRAVVQTIEQLMSGIKQGWAKIPLVKLQQLVSSIPKQ